MQTIFCCGDGGLLKACKSPEEGRRRRYTTMQTTDLFEPSVHDADLLTGKLGLPAQVLQGHGSGVLERGRVVQLLLQLDKRRLFDDRAVGGRRHRSHGGPPVIHRCLGRRCCCAAAVSSSLLAVRRGRSAPAAAHRLCRRAIIFHGDPLRPITSWKSLKKKLFF